MAIPGEELRAGPFKRPRDFTIIGANGAVLRDGPSLSSHKMGELDRGATVTGVELRFSKEGAWRVLVTTPLNGWLSLKLLEPTFTTAEKVGGFRLKPKKCVPNLTSIDAG